MLRFLMKIPITLWPFIKNAVLKDRTLREVIRTNQQFTILFGIVLLITATLMMTLMTLADTKSKLILTQREVEVWRSANPQPPSTSMETVTKMMGSDPADCIVTDYNKQRVIDLLR